MDKEEIINALGEVQYELGKVKKKLDGIVLQSAHYKKVYPELENSVRVLHRINDDIYKTVLIEKWGLIHSIN